MDTKNGHLCRIFAHRGASRQACENTRSAFDKALAYAIDGLETDVQLSRDGIAVLWHDQYLDKLGLPNRRIDDFDFEQIKAMRFSTATEPEGLMSLQDFLETYRGRCTLNIEVKNRDWESPLRQQSKMLLTLDMIGSSTVNDVFISSFNLASLIFAHQNRRHVPLFYILTEHHTQADIETSLQEQPFLAGFCLPISRIDATLVKRLRDHNKYIVTYTCNSQAEILTAFALDVDILITDEPQKALQLRA